MTSKTQELREAAVLYSELGWPVHPLRVGGKEPVTANGFRDATTDAEQLRTWWDRPYNVGLAVPVGCLVLDVDPRSGGVQTLRDLTVKLGKLPATSVAETRSRGLHLWFRTPHPAEELASTLGPGLDVKRPGKGYVVAPPSTVEPGSYRWRTVRALAGLPPSWSTKLFRPPREPEAVRTVTDPVEVEAQLFTALGHLRSAVPSARNNALNSSAYRLAVRGCLTTDAERQLSQAATELGLDPDEVDRTLASAHAGAERERTK